jgi:hypothetical protein
MRPVLLAVGAPGIAKTAIWKLSLQGIENLEHQFFEGSYKLLLISGLQLQTEAREM